jgi:ACT domain-containing protein
LLAVIVRAEISILLLGQSITTRNKAKKTLVGDGIDIWFANADDE